MTSTPPFSDLYSQLAAKIWYYALARGMCMMIIGLLTIISPFGTSIALLYLLGSFWLIDGLIELIDTFQLKGVPGRSWRLFYAVIGIVAGLLLLFGRPENNLIIFTFAIGASAIAGGLTFSISAFQLRPLTGWGWLFTFGVLQIVLGVFFLVWPGPTILTAMIWFGVWAMLAGIVLIIEAFQIRALGKRLAGK